MKLRVMIVDDEPISAQSTAIMTKHTGADLDVVRVCYSGRDAVVDAAVLYPDLVIMDIQMPGINGLEALARIKKQLPYVQFIILSAYSKFSYAVEALNLGACDYLLKPVKQEALNISIQKAISHIKDKKQDIDKELIQQEKLDIAQPMIVKDFIRALLPDEDADERLIACANFLGLSEKSCFIFTLSGNGVSAIQPMETILHKLSSQIAMFFDTISYELAIACVPVPTGAVQRAFAGETIASLEGFLSQYAQSGKSLSAGSGCIVNKVPEIKLSLLQAMSAMALSNTKEVSGCTIFDESTMPLSAAEKPFLYDSPEKEAMSSTKHIIDRAISYISKNHQLDLALDDVAAQVNLSPCYFSRLFKESTGVNFSEMLLQIRVDKAKELLLMEGSTIKDVAYKVGYNDPNYFSKVFRKTTGIKASDYRAMPENRTDS